MGVSLQRGSERTSGTNHTTPSRPRTAYYEGAEHLPGLSRRVWFRLAALLRWRGQLADDCAWRMVRHLTHWADERGRLGDLPAVIGAYAAHHGVSVRSAWADFTRLRTRGMVRQTAAPAPGRQARYVLATSPDMPTELPRTLARAVRDDIDPPAARAAGTVTRAQADALLADCEVIRHGSAAGPAQHSAAGCGRLHTSPYSLEGSPPSPPRPGPLSPDRARLAPSGGISDEDRAAGLYVVKACFPAWTAQRGRPPEFAPAEAAELGGLVALLLRHLPRGEVVELLTEQTRSALDLAGVVRYRIGRQLATLRRRARVRVDDDGQGYAAAMATLAAARAAQHEATAASRAAVRRALAEAARAKTSTGSPAEPSAAPPRRPPAAMSSRCSSRGAHLSPR